VPQTVVLHIGYPKTGTSSLQWFLHARREDLRRQGVYYPLAGQDSEHAHHRLALALSANPYETVNPDARAALFADLATEIDRCGCDRVLLSSELFMGRLELIQASAEFARLFEDRDVRVVCVLRSQETFLESLYRQFILDAQVRFADTFDAFLEAYPMAGEYHAILTAWSAFVGRENIVPLVYEQAVHGEGLLRGFCRLLGVDTDHLTAADLDVWHHVTHDTALGIEIVRFANRCPDLTLDQRLEVGRVAKAFAEQTRHLPLPKGMLSREQLDRIRATLLDSNHRLAADFVHQPLDGFWFSRDGARATA